MSVKFCKKGRFRKMPPILLSTLPLSVLNEKKNIYVFVQLKHKYTIFVQFQEYLHFIITRLFVIENESNAIFFSLLFFFLLSNNLITKSKSIRKKIASLEYKICCSMRPKNNILNQCINIRIYVTIIHLPLYMYIYICLFL